MSERAVWKGALRILELVIPIKVYPATESGDALALNQLHAVCKSRIQQKKSCPTCARDVTGDEIVKGYEFEAGRYVELLPAELEAIAPPSTREIRLIQFADVYNVERRMIDRTYFVVPDGPPAGPAREAYDLIRNAMLGTVGIGKLAIYGREYLIAVHPLPGAMMLYTLHHAAEWRTVQAVEDLRFAVAPLNKEALTIARRLIGALSGPIDFADVAFLDEYRDGLRQLIAAKIAGDEYVIPPPVPAPAIGNVRDALTASLTIAQAAAKRRARLHPTRRKVHA